MPAFAGADSLRSLEKNLEIGSAAIAAPQAGLTGHSDPYLCCVREYVRLVKRDHVFQQDYMAARLHPAREESEREFLFPLWHVLQHGHRVHYIKALIWEIE